MGVKGLLKGIRSDSKWGRVCKPYNIDDFSGKIGAVDAAALMYSSICFREPGDDVNFLQRFVKVYHQYAAHNVRLIFVLDGAANPAKARENAKRRTQRIATLEKKEQQLEPQWQELRQMEENLERMTNSVAMSTEDEFVLSEHASLSQAVEEKRVKLAKLADNPTCRVSSVHYRNLRVLFLKEKIPFLTSRNEAEKACAWLCKNGFCDFVLTDDSDALAYGAPVVVFNPWTSLQNTKRPKYVVHLKELLAVMNLTHDQFIEMCSLLPNDFGIHLDKVGLKMAYDIVVLHGSIEQWKKSLNYRRHLKRKDVKNGDDWDYMTPLIEFRENCAQVVEQDSTDVSELPARLYRAFSKAVVDQETQPKSDDLDDTLMHAIQRMFATESVAYSKLSDEDVEFAEEQESTLIPFSTEPGSTTHAHDNSDTDEELDVSDTLTNESEGNDKCAEPILLEDEPSEMMPSHDLKAKCSGDSDEDERSSPVLGRLHLRSKPAHLEETVTWLDTLFQSVVVQKSDAFPKSTMSDTADVCNLAAKVDSHDKNYWEKTASGTSDTCSRETYIEPLLIESPKTPRIHPPNTEESEPDPKRRKLDSN